MVIGRANWHLEVRNKSLPAAQPGTESKTPQYLLVRSTPPSLLLLIASSESEANRRRTEEELRTFRGETVIRHSQKRFSSQPSEDTVTGSTFHFQLLLNFVL